MSVCGAVPVTGFVPPATVAHSVQPIEHPCDHHRQDWPSALLRTPRSHGSLQGLDVTLLPPWPHGALFGHGPPLVPIPLSQVQGHLGDLPPEKSGRSRSLALRGTGL